LAFKGCLLFILNTSSTAFFFLRREKMTPMPSTAPSTNSAPQLLSGKLIEFQSPIDKNLSCDDE